MTRSIVPPEPPEWARAATLYQVNLRQFTPGGTLREFRSHLPRLAELGVGILWFMPIHPIGRVGRKGSLGSYYAVRDYRRINPEHGTLRDFDRTVDEAHRLGMRVLLDWVANHTARDHPWLRAHPEWYRRDELGRVRPPVPDWTDVIQLEFGPGTGARETCPTDPIEAGAPAGRLPRPVRALWNEMMESMELWVRDHGVDGFRCDVAAFLPLAFWQECLSRLRRHREVFLLAEADGPRMHDRAFHATYGWTLQRGLEAVRRREITPRELERRLRREIRSYPRNALRMQMTSNHDANSWAGSAITRLGARGAELGAVLSFLFPGIPLIYNGQEVGSRRRLAFFEKDEIPWRSHRFEGLYRNLTALKRSCPLLRSGQEGAPLRFVRTSDPEVLAFVREDARGSLLGVFRLGDGDTEVRLTPRLRHAASGFRPGGGPGRSPGADPEPPPRVEAGSRALHLPLRGWSYAVWISPGAPGSDERSSLTPPA